MRQAWFILNHQSLHSLNCQDNFWNLFPEMFMCQYGREWENEEERLAGVWYKGNPGFVGTKRSVALLTAFIIRTWNGGGSALSGGVRLCQGGQDTVDVLRYLRLVWTYHGTGLRIGVALMCVECPFRSTLRLRACNPASGGMDCQRAHGEARVELA